MIRIKNSMKIKMNNKNRKKKCIKEVKAEISQEELYNRTHTLLQWASDELKRVGKRILGYFVRDIKNASVSVGITRFGTDVMISYSIKDVVFLSGQGTITGYSLGAKSGFERDIKSILDVYIKDLEREMEKIWYKKYPSGVSVIFNFSNSSIDLYLEIDDNGDFSKDRKLSRQIK